VVDLNQEIKLSELFRRPNKKKKAAPAQTESKRAPKSRPKKAKKQQAQHKRIELVGLKVGASQLAAARVVNNGGTPRLMQLARTELEPGIVVSGEVRDVQGLADALDRFFTENKLPRRGIRLGIGTNRIGVRALDIDGVEDERQLENAVRFRAYEAFAIPMEDAVLDYHVLGQTSNGDGQTSRRVLLAAAYRQPIDQFIQAFRAANLELVGIDVEAFALLRAVASEQLNLPTAGVAAVVAVALGHDRSTLAISDGTTCDFMRVLEWGGSRLDTAIGRELGLTDQEAADLKEQISLVEGAEFDDPRLDRAAAAVDRELQGLARELVASLQAYQAEAGSLPIAEILVTGGTSRLPGLVSTLERMIRARVRAADPLISVRPEPGLSDRDDLASLAVAIGLGVER
jgi:type IV pilus assembly protein PilM